MKINQDDFDDFSEGGYPDRTAEYEEIDPFDIVPGMKLIEKSLIKEKHAYFDCVVVVWAGERRDQEVLIMDSNGHHYLMDPSGYVRLKNTEIAYRVIYGERLESDLKVTNEFYLTLEEFKLKTNHEGFCKFLWSSGKHIPVPGN